MSRRGCCWSTGDGATTDLAPDAGTELVEAAYSVSADGSTVATTLAPAPPARPVPDAVRSSTCRPASAPCSPRPTAGSSATPVISPDGARVAMHRERDGTFDDADRQPAADRRQPVTAATRVAAELGDLYPTEWAWSADSATLYVAGDCTAEARCVAVDPVTGGRPAPAGRRRRVLQPVPVARTAARCMRCARPIDCATAPGAPGHARDDQSPRLSAHARRRPGAAGPRWSRCRVRQATARRVHGWLCLPPARRRPGAGDAVDPRRAVRLVQLPGAGGGTRGSRSRTAGRCVLPDPALSTGYGQRWFERAWPYLAARRVRRLRGGARRRARAARRRRDAGGLPGRVVRRLHDELGRRAHRPLRRDRHARRAVGARPAAHDDRRGGVQDRHLRRAGRAPGVVRGELAAQQRRRGRARRCWSSTATATTGCR